MFFILYEKKKKIFSVYFIVFVVKATTYNNSGERKYSLITDLQTAES